MRAKIKTPTVRPAFLKKENQKYIPKLVLCVRAKIKKTATVRRPLALLPNTTSNPIYLTFSLAKRGKGKKNADHSASV
jgi:hypothetical protein